MTSEPSVPLSINDWREELSREKKKNDELTALLKNQERNYQKLVGELKTQLQAEQQKSLCLENSLQKVPSTINQVIELQAQLKQSEIKQKSLQDEFKHKIAEVQTQERENSALALAKDLNTFKEYAMAEITEKEKIIIEQKLHIEKSENTIQTLSSEIDYLQSLSLTDKQKHRIEIEQYKEKIEELEEELEEINHTKEENKHYNKTHQEEIDRHEITTDENKILKLRIESLQEELQLKTADLKNSEMKIVQLKESRQDLAENITKLENKIELLSAQKQEIIKGLENKEVTIHLLEEELESNAEGFAEHMKKQLEEANMKCKKLEKNLREMEQGYEEQLEEKMGIIATCQIRINDLTRKITLLDKDKESLNEKISASQKLISSLEHKLIEHEQKQSREMDSFKDKFKEKILQLKRERDDLMLKLSEMQELSNFGRPSIIDSGGSLFDELSQLPEGRYCRISLKPTSNEDSKQTEGLIAQLAEKETIVKNLISEKNSFETKLKETLTELKNLKQELTIAVKYSEKMSRELEMAKWELENLRSNEEIKLDQGKILVLESEKELLKADISRLETELMLSKENWAELNNSLYKDLLEAQAATAQAKSQLIRITEENDTLKAPIAAHKKKRSIGSWFKKES
jgi:hypothetical protein